MKRNELSPLMCGRILDSVLDYANVSNLVYEALDLGFESIQIFPNMIPKVLEVLDGRKLDICAVITYPHGVFTPEQKAFEIEDAISSGATQVEVVFNNGNVRDHNWDVVRKEVKACRKAAGNAVLKFILEVEFLTDDEISKASQIAMEEGADRLVTSIGVYNKVDKTTGKEVPIRCEKADIKKIKAVVGDKVKVVAQGLIDSKESVEEMLDAGADYIGSEFAAKIVRSLDK